MKKVELLEQTIEFISRYSPLDKDKISVDTAVNMLGFDSLGLINLLLEAEAEFDIKIDISEHEFPASFSVNDMTNLVAKLKGLNLEEETNRNQIKYSDDIYTVTNTKEALVTSVAKFGNNVAYWERRQANGGKYHPITYKEFGKDVDALGTGLIDMGLEDETMCIIGKTSYKYVTTCRTIMGGVGCVSPINKDFSEDEIMDLIIRSKSKAVFFTDENKEKIMNISKKIDTIQYYINMSGGDSDNNILGYDDILSKGNELVKNGDRRYIDKDIDNKKMVLLVWTSGTTGKPKGVMLSQENIARVLNRSQKVIQPDENDIFYSVLPAHHIFGQKDDFLTPTLSGAAVAFSDNIFNMQKDCQEIHPTVMFCVPAHIDFVLMRCLSGVKAQGIEKEFKQLFSQGDSGIEEAREKFKDSFKSIYDSFGGNFRLFMYGGSAASPEAVKMARFFGFHTIGGHGTTEMAATIAVSQLDNYKDESSMGKILPDLDWKIVNPNEDGIGELAVEPNMIGYLDDPESTNEVIKDGFYYTGDLVSVDDDGFFYYYTRKNNLIKTSNGEYISPEKLEAKLFSNQYIKECLVFDQTLKNQTNSILSVSIFPDKDKIIELIGDIDSTELQKLLQQQINEFNTTVPPHEIIRHVEISDTEFPKNAARKVQRFKWLAQRTNSQTSMLALTKNSLTGKNPATLETVLDSEVAKEKIIRNLEENKENRDDN